MKPILFLFCFLFFTTANAQIIFSPEENTKEATLDLSDNYITTKLTPHLVNNTSDTVALRWEIFKIDAPAEWEFQLSINPDLVGSYNWGFYSNIETSIYLDVPHIINSNDSSSMKLSIRPRGVAGCGMFEIRVAHVADTSNIISIGFFEYKINTSPDCTTSTFDLEKEKIQVFPNPTMDYFTITENTVVEEIRIFNIMGKRMKAILFQNGKEINVASFPNGFYLIKMLDKNREVVKTTRLIKK